MKKVLGIALISALVLSCAVTTAHASDTIYLPELDMSVEMPDGWIVLTRNMRADDPNFALMGTDKETNDKYLEEKGFYLDATSEDGSEEIIIVSGPDDAYDIYDLSLLSKVEIADLIQKVIDNLSDYYTVVDSAVYETGQTIYLRMDVNDLDGDRKRYCREYGTFIGGWSTVFVYISYDRPFTPQQGAVFKSIVDSAVFMDQAKQTPVPETVSRSASAAASDNGTATVLRNGMDAALGLAIGFGGPALIAAVVYAIVRLIRRRSARDSGFDGYYNTKY